MPVEPAVKRAISFFDGQNLFRAVKKTFGYHYPNFDPIKLSEALCRAQGWQLEQVRFYTGVPSAKDSPLWHDFWKSKLGALGHRGAWVYSRPLRYREVRVTLPDGTKHTVTTNVEKGIDVRIALDVTRLAFTQDYDVALIFSQDQDLSEVADEIRRIARTQGRWIKIAWAFPFTGSEGTNKRGINSTDWIRIDKALYDACIDPKDYRLKPAGKEAPPRPT